MKKYSLLILTLIILILSFLNCWYSAELLDLLFIVTFILNLVLFIIYIICFKIVIEEIIKNKNILNVISLCILIMNIIIITIFPFREAKTYLELNLYKEEYEKVVKLVKDKGLVTYEYDNAKLPKELKKISISGEISIYKNDEEGQIIGFWIFRGMLSGSTQLIYSSCDEKLIEESEFRYSITSIKELEDNWYYVEFD